MKTEEKDLSSQVQIEVARLRDTISAINALLPNSKHSFIFYDLVIASAKKAIRDQDAVALCRLLPELRSME